MDTLKDILVIRLTWRAFSRLREKHPDLLFDIDNGQFLFTDNWVDHFGFSQYNPSLGIN